METIEGLTEAQEEAERFAQAIHDLDDAAKALLGAGLTERAIVLLLDDRMGGSSPGRPAIRVVLRTLPQLANAFTKLPAANREDV